MINYPFHRKVTESSGYGALCRTPHGTKSLFLPVPTACYVKPRAPSNSLPLTEAFQGRPILTRFYCADLINTAPFTLAVPPLPLTMDTDTSEAAFPGPSHQPSWDGDHRGRGRAHAGTTQLLPLSQRRCTQPRKKKRKEQKKIMPVYCLHVCVSKDMVVLDLGGSRCRMDLTGEHWENATQPPCRSHPVHYRWPELLAQLHGHIFNTEEEQHKPHHWVYAEHYIFLELI